MGDLIDYELDITELYSIADDETTDLIGRECIEPTPVTLVVTYGLAPL